MGRRCVDGCAGVEAEAHAVCMALVAGYCQRGFFVRGRCVDGRACLEAEAGAAGVPGETSEVERSGTIFSLLCGACACADA